MSEVDTRRSGADVAPARADGAAGGSRRSSDGTQTMNAPPDLAGRRSGGRGFVILGGIVLAVALVAGVVWWLGRNEVGSDNAHLDGHVVPITARTAGFVDRVLVTENQGVAAGDTLVVLDDRDLSIQLQRMEADLDALLATVGREGRAGQAAAQLAAARATAAAAQAAVAQAEANAQKAGNDLARYQRLAEDSIVSRQQLDAAETGVRTAQAQVTAARRNAQAAAQQVVAAEAALSGADARVQAARAARDQVALQLSYTRIIAPVTGVVSKRNVEPGQMAQPGQPLMSLVPLDSVWAVANLKETEIRDVAIGDSVDIRVDAYPGRHVRGTVESISAATGSMFSLLPPDNATGNFVKVVQRIPVRIRLVDRQDPEALLRPGMSIEVKIHTR